jgi:hypothetical protein
MRITAHEWGFFLPRIFLNCHSDPEQREGEESQ